MTAGGQWCEDHGYVHRDMTEAHDAEHQRDQPEDSPAGCCQACQGRGGTSEGLCSDCYATGCAHPPPLCPQPGENPVEGEAPPLRWHAGIGQDPEVVRLVDAHNALLDRVTALEQAARDMLAAWGPGPDVDVRTRWDRFSFLEETYIEGWEIPADTMRPLLEALDAALRAQPSPGDTQPHRETPDPPTGHPHPTTTNT